MVLLSALSLTLLATLVSSTPTPSSHLKRGVLPVRKSSAGISAKELVEHGLARIAHYNGRASNEKRGIGSGTVTNEDVSYIAAVTVGTQTFDLIVDTGSSNTWVGAGTKYVPGSTSNPTGGKVSVSYGSGSFSGTEYIDSVSFAGMTVPQQSIGVASTSSGFIGVDGILGVGPVDLTEGTVSNANTVPTFLDNLKSQGSISTEMLGVYFKPESGSDTGDANGELTLGGTDPSKYKGSITYFPKTFVPTFSEYWGLSGVVFLYNNEPLISLSISAIVDTGTTLIYIPTGAYDEFKTATGGTTDSNSGLLSFTTAPTGTFIIVIDGKKFPLTPAQYLIPAAQYSILGLTAGKSYSWINNGGSIADGVNIIIGQKFLENYYSVFDTTNSRIGFATNA